MKVVVLLSKTFFPQHYRAGELTGFADKVKYTIWVEDWNLQHVLWGFEQKEYQFI